MSEDGVTKLNRFHERMVVYRYQQFGAGDRLRLLDRLGIDRAEVDGLAPHEQLRKVGRLVVAAELVDMFMATAEGMAPDV
jgi:hypothetical protein